MTRPTRQHYLRQLRAYLAACVEEDEASAGGLPAASKAKWLVKHLDVFTGGRGRLKENRHLAKGRR